LSKLYLKDISMKKVLYLLGKILLILFFLVVILLVRANYRIISLSQNYIVDYPDQLPEGEVFQTVITPWAAVYSDWRLSSITRGRVMNSIEVFNKWFAKTILVSWDNWTNQYNEVRFHLYRAVYLARKLWIDARWVRAWWYQPRWWDKMMFRENLARVKAWWEILLWSSPKFLGEQVPIDGESNWWVG